MISLPKNSVCKDFLVVFSGIFVKSTQIKMSSADYGLL